MTESLAERLHAVIGLKTWDEIGVAQGIYELLAAEALAWMREQIDALDVNYCDGANRAKDEILALLARTSLAAS